MALCTLFPILILAGSLAADEPAEQPVPDPVGNLTLAAALEAALLGNPALAAAGWELPIADARVMQARLRPNPELSIEAEGLRLGGAPSLEEESHSLGIGLDGSLDAGYASADDRTSGGMFSETEFTLSLSQLIELGGKRAARIAAAGGGIEVARWEYEALRFQIIGDVIEAYTAVLAAQARVEQAERLHGLATRLADTVSARVEAGAVSPIERHRALAQAERQRVALAAAEEALVQARIGLVVLWGSASPQFERAVGDLEAMPPLAALPEILQALEEHPDLQRWAAELERREREVTLARSEAVPDLTLRLGYRASRIGESRSRGRSVGTDGVAYSRSVTDSDDDWQSSLVLEASIPLPLFNRNQGRIREAELRVSQAADERVAADRELRAAVAQRHAAAEGARERIAALETDVLPGLQKAYELTEEGYRRGKFGFLDVIDAERTLVEARIEALDVRIDYHRAVAGLERILGQAAFADTSNAPEVSISEASEDHSHEKEHQ